MHSINVGLGHINTIILPTNITDKTQIDCQVQTSFLSERYHFHVIGAYCVHITLKYLKCTVLWFKNIKIIILFTISRSGNALNGTRYSDKS